MTKFQMDRRRTIRSRRQCLGSVAACCEGWVMGFHVGQKVARIPGTYNSCTGEGPAVGEVCTVVNVFTVLGGWRTQIELAEHPAPETISYFAGFNAAAFRPVVERKTDISIFEAMLNPSKRKVEANSAA